MEGVMVSTSTGVITSLLTKLTTLLEKKHTLIRDVKKDITSLKDEMSSMNALLVKLATMEEELDVQQKDWRDKVRELAFDMEDCIDIFMHKVGGDADAKSGLMPRLKILTARYKIANLVEELKSRAVEISNFRDRYRLHEPGRSGVVPVDPRMQAIYAQTNSLVGIDGPREKIILWLMEKGAQQVKVMSIVGFGGVGKTTLANQVHNKIKGQFEGTAFISVSRYPNIIKSLSDLLLARYWRLDGFNSKV